jgi:acyl carrier protein
MEALEFDYVQAIVNYVKSLALVDPSLPIPLDESLLEVGILDSFGIVEMLTFCESEFDILILDEDMTKEKLGSIRKIAHYVQHRKAEQCATSV